MQDILSHQNFIQLSKEVNEYLRHETWWSRYGMELLKFALKGLAFAASWWVFAQSSLFGLPGLVNKIIGLLLLSTFYYGIAITGIHESSHKSFVRTARGNDLWSYFFSDFWVGQSSRWWHHHHVEVHHVYTNVPDVEPNLYFYPWLNRYLYFFAVPYLLIFWLIVGSIEYLWKKWGKLATYGVLMLAGYAFNYTLFALVVPPLWAVLCVFLMRSFYAPMFLHIATFNHIGLDHPEARLPWLPHHTNTTRNLKHHWFLSVVGGNAFIECHIEHHLFPTFSNALLTKIRPLVLKYVKKEGYRYVEESYWFCLKNCVKYYKTLFAHLEEPAKQQPISEG